jgi:ribosomal protein S18 acetylase RimI-like enzyme
MRIYRVTKPTEQLSEALATLLPQLSTSATMPSEEHLESMLNNKNFYLFVAEHEGTIVGMLSLVVVDIPTGRKAWIEDVVVDGCARGLHIGQSLVERAKAEAAALRAKKIYLTSNPSRKAAHALYKKCGFEEYNTTVFRVKG